MSVPARRTRMVSIAVALFALGLLAVIAIFVLAATGVHAPWLWAVTMLAPVGLVLALVDAVRSR